MIESYKDSVSQEAILLYQMAQKSKSSNNSSRAYDDEYESEKDNETEYRINYDGDDDRK